MGNESVNFDNPLSNTKSKEYKEFARSAREGVSIFTFFLLYNFF